MASGRPSRSCVTHRSMPALVRSRGEGLIADRRGRPTGLAVGAMGTSSSNGFERPERAITGDWGADGR